MEALILDNLEEGKSRETIVKKLVRHFSLTDEEAAGYFEKYKNNMIKNPGVHDSRE